MKNYSKNLLKSIFIEYEKCAFYIFNKRQQRDIKKSRIKIIKLYRKAKAERITLNFLRKKQRVLSIYKYHLQRKNRTQSYIVSKSSNKLMAI